MPLDNINDVFPNATFDGTNITLPVADLPNFNTGNDVQEGAELVYALVSKLNSVVSAAGHSSLSSTFNDTFDNSALTLARAITVTSVLDVAGQLDNLDVKLDSSNVVPNLALAFDGTVYDTTSQGVYDKSDDTTADALAGITFTSDGVAVLPSTIGTDFTLSVDDADFDVVDNGSDAWVLKLTNASKADATYNLTLSVEDNRLGVDQQPSVTATISIVVQA